MKVKRSKKVKGRKPTKREFSSYVGNKKTKSVLTAVNRNKTSFTKPVGFACLKKDDVILLQRHLVKMAF